MIMSLIGLTSCSSTQAIHLKVSLPPRPTKPIISASEAGDMVMLSKADMRKLTQYIILLEGYSDSLELALAE